MQYGQAGGERDGRTDDNDVADWIGMSPDAQHDQQ